MSDELVAEFGSSWPVEFFTSDTKEVSKCEICGAEIEGYRTLSGRLMRILLCRCEQDGLIEQKS